MALNASGPISLGGSTAGQSINLELGQSATAQVSLNDSNVRSLAGVASGAIIMPTNFYGKAASSNTIYILEGNPSTAPYQSWDGYGTAAFSGAPSDFGSISGTNKVTVFGAATLLQCYYYLSTDPVFPAKKIFLAVSGNQTSTSWSSMTIDGTTFTKATLGGAGSYVSGGNYTTWNATVTADPFAAFPGVVVFA